jgi:hypothetical protein
MIDKNNIDDYLPGYFEGNLDPLIMAELMAFLAENPEYERLLPELDTPVDPNPIPALYDTKGLKKDFSDVPLITNENFEEFCIAAAEGLLAPADRKRLNHFIAHDAEKQAVLDLYGQLRLKPDMRIVFPLKNRLKKPAAIEISLSRTLIDLAVAAAIGLLILLSGFHASHRHAEPSGIAAVKEHTASPLPQTSEPEIKVSAVSARPVAKKLAVPIQPEAGMATLLKPEMLPVTLERTAPPAEIRPVAARLEMPDRGKDIKRLTASNTNITAYKPLLPQKPEMDEEPSAARVILAVAKKVNFWKAAESALTGFDYLTESRLTLSKTTDENGKLTSFTLADSDLPLASDKTK